MLDWERNLTGKKERRKFLLSEIEEYVTIAVTSKICSINMREVKNLIDADNQDDRIPRPFFTSSPLEVDKVSKVLASISPTLDDALLYDSLQDRSEMSKFNSSIGSTNGTTGQFLVGNDTKTTVPSTDNDLLVDSKDMLDDLYAKATKGNI